MTLSSQQFESFVPVYDTVPEDWKDARTFLVEHLKKISNAVNVREIGFYLDQEVLSGKQFIPTSEMSSNLSSTSEQFRSVLRKVVDVSPLTAGANTFPHDITYDANFTLIDLWVSATDSSGLTSQVITNTDITLDATDININSPGAFDRAFAFVEYIQEV